MAKGKKEPEPRLHVCVVAVFAFRGLVLVLRAWTPTRHHDDSWLATTGHVSKISELAPLIMHQQAKAVSFTTCKSQHKTNYCKNTSVVSTWLAPAFAGAQEQGNAVPFLATNSLGGARGFTRQPLWAWGWQVLPEPEDLSCVVCSVFTGLRPRCRRNRTPCPEPFQVAGKMGDSLK